MKYDFIIVGAGIAGCSIAYELSKTFNNILLVDRNSSICSGASGAAGAFLSPLLGKNNSLKNLVTRSLKYSTKFYKKNIATSIINKGVLRIPKNNIDNVKFQNYIPYLDFQYKTIDNGYFFDIGSHVNNLEICKYLSKNIDLEMDLEISEIKFVDNIWILNSSIKTDNLILTTGADTSLIEEDYFKIRPVWGQKIEIETQTETLYNYHKNCSISVSQKLQNGKNKITIGATHHRYNCDHKICSYCLKIQNINNDNKFTTSNAFAKEDTQKLLILANDILNIKDPNILNIKIGARAASIDYLPIVGELINSKETLKNYPYIKYGTKVPCENYTRYQNLYVLNGLGGRGFVLSPYLAKQLANKIISTKKIDSNILSNRLFKRWSLRLK